VKIVLLAAASSIHAIRWANGLSAMGHKVHLVSQHRLTDELSERVVVHSLPFKGMSGYYLNALIVRKIVNRIKPDILNVHYASGYGTTARLVRFHPYVLSVWGSDVYDFPYKSGLHKKLIQKNLKAADSIASTSVCMAEQTKMFLHEHEEIYITPFGVDIDNFAVERERHAAKVTIGTVKTLAPKYGIDTLIRAFGIARKKLEAYGTRINLQIVGDGPQRTELERLTVSLDLQENVEFVGSVQHKEVPNRLRGFDVFVALSRLDSESFGVAIVEASAASLPVLVSDVGGLPEVTRDGVTGFVVKKDDPQGAADKLVELCQNNRLREQMGKAGYQFVSERYSWQVCIENMLDVYKNAIHKARS